MSSSCQRLGPILCHPCLTFNTPWNLATFLERQSLPSCKLCSERHQFGNFPSWPFFYFLFLCLARKAMFLRIFSQTLNNYSCKTIFVWLYFYYALMVIDHINIISETWKTVSMDWLFLCILDPASVSPISLLIQKYSQYFYIIIDLIDYY